MATVEPEPSADSDMPDPEPAAPAAASAAGAGVDVSSYPETSTQSSSYFVKFFFLMDKTVKFSQKLAFFLAKNG